MSVGDDTAGRGERLLLQWEDWWAVTYGPGEGEQAEQRLKQEQRCTYQLAAPGRDGPGRLCGQPVTESAAGEPHPEDGYCPEHQAEAYGDHDGALQERQELIEYLLSNAHGTGLPWHPGSRKNPGA